MIDPAPSLHAADADVITSAVSHVRTRIASAVRRAGRSDAVEICAVAKYLHTDGIPMLYETGIRTFGESRPAALLERATAHAALPDVRFDFVGRVQSRAVKDIVPYASRIHAISTASAVRQLAAAREAGHLLPSLLVQVNVDGDPSKAGVTPALLDEFLGGLPPGIVIDGLMTMPALAMNPEQSRGAFAALNELAVAARSRWNGVHPLTALSMGTSQDFEVAIEEGATIVRLGRVLYAVEDTLQEARHGRA